MMGRVGAMCFSFLGRVSIRLSTGKTDIETRGTNVSVILFD